MSSEAKSELCREVEEELARIADGTAARELFEHVASCDACRDARHEAERAARAVGAAAADYVHPTSFDDALLAKLDARPKRADESTKAEARTELADPPAPAGEKHDGPADGRKTEPADEREKEPADEAKDGPSDDSRAHAMGESAGRVGARVLRLSRSRKGIGAAIVALTAAAAAVALHHRSPATSHPSLAAADVDDGPWSGTIATVSRASADRAGGLELCTRAGHCAPARAGDRVEPGGRVRTDARTRAHLALRDGTEIALDRNTELELVASRARAASLVHGTLVADVAHLDSGPNARVTLPNGFVEVVGTKFQLRAQDDRSSVEVLRGAVRFGGEGERVVTVRAGEQGRLFRNTPPIVGPTTAIADAVEWSEDADRPSRDDDGAKVRGLGELRARKPGETTERDHAVHLAKHSVKVRVVDNVARTEIDETFANETGDTLEGVYRFPLPPDAHIERLALEVNGKLEEGAFVERDKAAAIWRGVIQHATPHPRKPTDDIIWVPGPWRDPALLEWQRGGRFELKIFPIPAHGARRVVLAYTQELPPAAGMRRYTYPLAYDPSGSTSIDRFDVDVQVIGNDKSLGVRPSGYELREATATDGAGERLTMSASSFVPAGDLSFEYALPDRGAEAAAWAYQPESSGKADGSDAPYVAIALRPELPRATDERAREQVIVVDASRSMVGERWARASKLAARIVREMDAGDRFRVLACDTTCRSMEVDDDEPGEEAAARVEKFLAGIEPEGGTDLVEAVKAARAASRSRGSRELRIVYLGDGTPSVGPLKPDHLTAEIERVLPAGEGRVTAVAIGADADTTSLGALARGGGGVVVPYVPGQRLGAAAIAVLEATYGVALREPSVKLPPGLVAVAPARLDTIPAGGEAIVVARMASDFGGATELAGDVELRGKVGGDEYAKTIPLRIVASSAKGNAFVPRLYAATRIAFLERTSGDAAKSEIVDLSKRFAVASRYTSLLVLESEAMFHAYGLDRTRIAPSWTGEEQADSTVAQGYGEAAKDDLDRVRSEEKSELESRFGDDVLGAAGTVAPKKSAAMSAGRLDMPAPAPTTAAPTGGASRPSSMADEMPLERPMRQRARPLVPMRRVWDRKGSIAADATALHAKDGARIDAAERALSANPDSRAKVKDLYEAYAVAGRLDRALDLATTWSRRDPLDPEAIVARADLAARAGDRDRAIRILGGVVDVRPDDVAAQTRLAELRERSGDRTLACEHRIALADLRPGDGSIVAAAVRCAREQGSDRLADRLVADAPTDAVRRAVDRALAASPTTALRGDVQVEASWDGDADLDVALVDPNGRRLSWLGGGKSTVTARDATSSHAEAVGFVNLGSGTYLVEATRASSGRGSDDGAPVHGTITLRAVGETRTIPFTLTGDRVEVGQVRVYYAARLVPVPWGAAIP